MNTTHAAQTTWPKYLTDALAQRMEKVTGLHLTATIAQIEAQYNGAAMTELGALRTLVDGVPGSVEFWPRIGFRQITEALAAELHLAKFKTALESPDYAYTTGGHPVSPNSFHVYHRAKTPTGVAHVISARKSCVAAAALVSAHDSTREGGKASGYEVR